MSWKYEGRSERSLETQDMRLKIPTGQNYAARLVSAVLSDKKTSCGVDTAMQHSWELSYCWQKYEDEENTWTWVVPQMEGYNSCYNFPVQYLSAQFKSFLHNKFTSVISKKVIWSQGFIGITFHFACSIETKWSSPDYAKVKPTVPCRGQCTLPCIAQTLVDDKSWSYRTLTSNQGG